MIYRIMNEFVKDRIKSIYSIEKEIETIKSNMEKVASKMETDIETNIELTGMFTTLSQSVRKNISDIQNLYSDIFEDESIVNLSSDDKYSLIIYGFDLEKAIEEEDYIKCAEIRDNINSILR